MAAVNNLKMQFERLSTAMDEASSSSPDKTRRTRPDQPVATTKQSPNVISKKQLKQIGKAVGGSSPNEVRKSKVPQQPKSRSFDEAPQSAAMNVLADVIKKKNSQSPSSSGSSTPLTQSGGSSDVHLLRDDHEVLLRARVNSTEERETKGLSAPLPIISPKPKGSPKIKPKLAPKPAHINTPPGTKPTLPPKPKIIPGTVPTKRSTNSSSPETPPPPHPVMTKALPSVKINDTVISPPDSVNATDQSPVDLGTPLEISLTLSNEGSEAEECVIPVELPVELPAVSEGSSNEDCAFEGGSEECLVPSLQVQSTAKATSDSEVIGECKRNTIDSGYQEDVPPEEDVKEKWDTVKRTKAREKRKQIAMELLETERTYVGRLKIIAEDFKQAIQGINTKSTKPVIPEATINVIFLNIGEIYNLNRQLLDDLESRMNNWTEKEQIGDVISSIAPFLKLYSMYTAGFEDAMKKLTETMAKEKKLDVTVKEFEKNLGTGLGVAHYMLEPVQRIPRYKLLLEAYFKKLPEDSPEVPSMTKALDIIGEAADRTNNRIKELENSNEILAIQRTILDYEGTLLLAHRRFIKKGILQKLSRKTQAPRMFFLFSDVLLHTEPTGPSTYKFKNELPLCAVKMELPKVSLVPHSFELFSTNRSFILSAKSEEEMIEWMTALGGAIRDDKEKMKSLKRGEQLLTLDRSGFGSSAPILVPDQSVSMCQICSKEFTFTFRRHHCRACGRVVCGNCSPHKAFLSYMNKEERICSVCNHHRKQSAGDEVDGEVEQPISRARIPSVLILDHENEAIIGGYVLEQDGKKWNRCWYVVGKDLALYKYKAHEDIRATETVPLPGYRVTTDRVTMTINLLHHQAKKKKLNLSFKTENVADFETWVDVIEKASQLVVSEVPTSPENRSSVGPYGSRRRSQSLHNLIDPKPFEVSPAAAMTPPVPTKERTLSSSMNNTSS